MRIRDMEGVQTLARCVRREITDVTPISNEVALEIASKALGFGSWDECKKSFNDLKFHEFIKRHGSEGESQEVLECATILKRENLSFFNHTQVVHGGISAARSTHEFLLPVLELGLRYAPSHELRRAISVRKRVLPYLCKAVVSRSEVRIPWYFLSERLNNHLIQGDPGCRRVFIIPDENVPLILERGLDELRNDQESGRINLQQLKSSLRAPGLVPNDDVTLLVRRDMIESIRRICQVWINESGIAG